MVRSLVRSALDAVGLEVRRRRPRAAGGATAVLREDAREAVHYARGGVASSFLASPDVVRDVRGFSFASAGWHPWTAEVVDQRRRGNATYPGSLLERFHGTFRPPSALAALAGFSARSGSLERLPAHLFWLTPWFAHDVDALERSVRDWVARGARSAGVVDYDFERDGTPYHGPVSSRHGQAETTRLHEVAEALQRTGGWDRAHGDSLGYLVRRGSEHVVVKFGGGYHRTAAMAALALGDVPVRLREPVEVDVRDVDDWPQVRRGTWDRDTARRYVDHLFDFDAAGWARARGLA
ncbi:hypothetical protein [Egicoccus halophilus]|uniref:Uncharacterized protein n=1 Tax=Egicoccus halophilus TaxID=1670830 RepID=A0A8J3ETD7_9ACTN|nr:hypothetical protein [Egicoccus halophilus]GGI05414.1 hypothetical protein GCM10011354_13980 [Egicoccus halophilus]